MHTLAAGASIHWNGIDGWLVFLACVSFLLAALTAVGKIARWSHLPLFFIALGLLLWAVTGIVGS